MEDEQKESSCCGGLSGLLEPDVFKALADPNRLLILAYLAQARRELNVSDVSCCCPVDVSVVSRHLGVLRDAGILEARKQGREVYYSVRVSELSALLRRLADELDACCPQGVVELKEIEK